jgi:hypothetical protein
LPYNLLASPVSAVTPPLPANADEFILAAWNPQKID